MKAAAATKFERMPLSQLGQGITVEYRDNETIGGGSNLLAYIDFNEDKTMAGVVLSNPYAGGKQRRYSVRPAANARAIVAKHIARMGYEAVEPEL